MTRFEKFQKFESEIKEKYENFSRIDSEYVEVVREYLKMIEEVDEIREESLQIPRDSEEGRLFQRKLEDKRKLEAMKYHQEYVLYSKRMELYAEICRTDHSQFLRENLPALQAPVTVENRSNAAEIGGDDSSILSAATETEGTIESYHKMNEEFLEEQRKRIFNRFMLENSEFQPLVHSSPASKTIDDTEFSDFSEFTNTQDQEDPIAAYFEFEREVLFGESDRSDPTGKTQQPSDSDRSNTAGKFDEIIDVIKENGAEDSFTFNDLVSPSNAVEQVTPPKSTTRKSQLPQPTFKTSKRHPGGSPVSPRTPTAPNLSQFSPNRTQTTPEQSPTTPPQSRLRPPRSPWTPSPRTPTQTPKTSRAPIRRRKTPETTPNSSFKRKLRTPEETPTSSLHTPKRAPGHKISKLSFSKQSSHSKPSFSMRADIEKLKNLVDGISRKTKEPVTEHVKGKCNEILNSFFSEIKSRQLKTLDCRAIMSKPRANRSILLLKQLKKLLEMYSQELNNDLDKKVLN